MGSRPLNPSEVVLPDQGDEIIDRNVPCGTCHACCEKTVYLFPEDGDPTKYRHTITKDGRFTLQRHYMGPCVYLDEKTGCTIHDDKPVMCREFDCRLMMLNPPHIYKKMMSHAQIKQAKKMLKGMKRQSDNKRRLDKTKKQ